MSLGLDGRFFRPNGITHALHGVWGSAISGLTPVTNFEIDMVMGQRR